MDFLSNRIPNMNDAQRATVAFADPLGPDAQQDQVFAAREKSQPPLARWDDKHEIILASIPDGRQAPGGHVTVK
jgi:hypothetical protein